MDAGTTNVFRSLAMNKLAEVETVEELEAPSFECVACGARLLCLRSACLVIALCPGCGLTNTCGHHD